jgi:hypothetical protein
MMMLFFPSIAVGCERQPPRSFRAIKRSCAVMGLEAIRLVFEDATFDAL